MAEGRRPITIATLTSLVLAAVVVAEAIAADHGGYNPTFSAKTNDKWVHASPLKQISYLEKAIKVVCSSTDYPETCKRALEMATKGQKAHPKGQKAHPKDHKAHPKDLVKMAIKAAGDEVSAVMKRTEMFKFKSDEEKGALEDCKKLFYDATEELNISASSIVGDVKELTSKSSDLNNWLSAVRSYLETCVDGFPHGKIKADMKKALKTANELTSNSLAIISNLSSLLSTFGIRRHLLAEKPSRALDVDEEGFATWMSGEERKMLRNPNMPTPNVTVDKNGSGQFKTINEALAALPKTYTGRYVIYVKAGIYNETVIFTKNMENITLFGDGSHKSIITGNKNYVDGVRTFQTASCAVEADGFMAGAMGFRNTAGPEKHQAVGLRVKGDRAIFLHCSFEGYQDTLYAQTHRQYYQSCVISGTLDFIFGDAASVFQNCLIMVRKPLDHQKNTVTAHGRADRHEETGIVLQNCNIVADATLLPVKDKFKSYLGRPWKEFSRTVIMESNIDDFIHPEGWMPWDGDFALNTLYYAEYNNIGPGATLTERVNWAGYQKDFNRTEAEKFTVGTFLEADWIKAANVPVHIGLSG